MLTPFVCLPTGSGEDQPAPVGTDGFLEFAAQVVNNGPAVSDAAVVINLPQGLRLADEGDEAVSRLEKWWSEDSDGDETPLECTTSTDGSVVTCATGSVPAGANFLVLVDLEPQDDAVPGTSGQLSVTLQSTPIAGVFPTTSVQATVDFVGTAHLQVTLTPAKATVTVGNSLTLTASVHNLGPHPAVEAASIGFVDSVRISDDQPFMITNSQPFPGQEAGSTDASDSAFRLRSVPARIAAAKASVSRSAAARTTAHKTAAAEAPTDLGFWPIGTIAVGATATVQVVVKAEYAGQASLEFFATSADGSCDDEAVPGCENTAAADLTAAAAVTTTTSTTAASTTAASTTATTTPASATSTSALSTTSVPAITTSTSTAVAVATLPNTGFRPAPWVGSAGAAILLGAALIVLGAPRRRAYGGQHR